MAAENYKRLVRLYLPGQGFAPGERISLSDGQAHYLRSVMRKAPGDALRVFNGHDGEWLAVVDELSKKQALIKLDRQLLEQKTGADIWVLASPVKKEAFDLMIEKSCELGAAKFIPVICDHTVVHKINQERLQSIATEAAEQSERLDVMMVESLRGLKEILGSSDYQRDLIFCLERAEAVPLVETARKLAGKPLAILVGPEGGFSVQEIDFISHLDHVHPVTLGTQVLKAETALIAALSCVQLLSGKR